MFVPINTLNDRMLTNQSPSTSVQDTKPNNAMIAGCIPFSTNCYFGE
ncbi:hypothetical protein LEP1GSC128_3053 [Leptospira borgpetersenii str. 200801926]|uniref:Lipoprotein n=1 Tax=Leptospira borgpetersenii str. 200801926 TaxID=1193009 RepID=A0ABN0HWF2_LEPBO|nr:hypothetical protein LEP1GSC128_3053 [Leptospira borgpetersenii str. 200801926]EKR01929.1 hypothetical protein LEP1GSC121_3965 [Leptospira borgpetersenii serovar Castellonis str. 200801910]